MPDTVRHGCIADGIRNPNIVIGIDENAMRPGDHARAEAPNHIAVQVVKQYRVDVAADAEIRTAAFRDPDMSAVVGRIDSAGGAPFATVGQLGPAFYHLVRVRRAVLCDRRSSGNQYRQAENRLCQSHACFPHVIRWPRQSGCEECRRPQLRFPPHRPASWQLLHRVFPCR